MKLSKKKMVLVSFMLFSLFFGAGNLIFPPFLGQNAGANALPAMLGFLMTGRMRRFGWWRIHWCSSWLRGGCA